MPCLQKVPQEIFETIAALFTLFILFIQPIVIRLSVIRLSVIRLSVSTLIPASERSVEEQRCRAAAQVPKPARFYHSDAGGTNRVEGWELKCVGGVARAGVPLSQAAEQKAAAGVELLVSNGAARGLSQGHPRRGELAWIDVLGAAKAPVPMNYGKKIDIV